SGWASRWPSSHRSPYGPAPPYWPQTSISARFWTFFITLVTHLIPDDQRGISHPNWWFPIKRLYGNVYANPHPHFSGSCGVQLAQGESMSARSCLKFMFAVCVIAPIIGCGSAEVDSIVVSPASQGVDIGQTVQFT